MSGGSKRTAMPGPASHRAQSCAEPHASRKTSFTARDKEAFKPTPGQPVRAHDLPLIIGPSRREDSICQIDGNGRSIHAGLLSFEDLIPTPISTQTRCGKGRHGAVGNRAPGGSCHNVPVTFTFNRMRALVLVLASLVPLCAVAQKLPRDVARYLEDRRLCDHFRGEPTEGNLPEQVGTPQLRERQP